MADGTVTLGDLATASGTDVIQTPFVAIELDALERNLDRLQSACDATRHLTLRPHFKSHKCSAIALRQMERGAVGLTCATTEELEMLARAGVRDLLLANVVADRTRLGAVARTATVAKVTVAVDSVAVVELLDRAAEEAGATIGAVVELDIGSRRNGVETVEEALELAKRCAACPHLRLDGVMAYEGHLVDLPDREERLRRVQKAFAPALTVFERLRVEELSDHPVLTGGSSATYGAAAATGVATEVQAGTYALMDATYVGLAPEFEIAVALIGTVTTSRPDGRIVVNAGSKRMGLDWGSPALAAHQLQYNGTSEEHSMFRVSSDAPYRVGDRVAIVPGHICTTMAMHRQVFGIRNGALEEVLEIDGRDVLA